MVIINPVAAEDKTKDFGDNAPLLSVGQLLHSSLHAAPTD